jgi:site-specific recombinase XerD
MILLAPHIAAFLQQRLPIERRASPNTCDSYAHAFRLLFEYASTCIKLPPSQLQLEQLDAPLIVNFLNHLETSRGNGAGSRNIRLAAIKSFMHYMEYRVPSALEQIQRILAIPAKKTDTRLVRHLTAQEMQSILDAPDPTVRDGIRDRAMLHLCFAGGLRVSELVGLRLEDMVLQPQANVLIHGKGRKERCLPLWKETASAVRAWLSVRGEVRVPELFPNARNDAMTRAGFEYILRKHVHTAETRCSTLSSKRVSPHVLRHYLPFRTMSSSRRALTKSGRNSRRDAQSPWRSPNIVGCQLQTVQERKESVARFVSAGLCVRRGCPRKRFFLHGKCCLEINLCRLNTFVSEP